MLSEIEIESAYSTFWAPTAPSNVDGVQRLGCDVGACAGLYWSHLIRHQEPFETISEG